MADTRSFDDRDGWIWIDGKLVPWREANVHVLTHAMHYASSVFEDASPAPAWTRTSTPSPTSWPAMSGVRATRVSPSAVSRGTAIFIRVWSLPKGHSHREPPQLHQARGGSDFGV